MQVAAVIKDPRKPAVIYVKPALAILAIVVVVSLGNRFLLAFIPRKQR